MAGSFRSNHTNNRRSSKQPSVRSLRSVVLKRPSDASSSSKSDYHDARQSLRSWKFWKTTPKEYDKQDEEPTVVNDHSSSMRDSWSVWRSASLRLSTVSSRTTGGPHRASSLLSRRPAARESSTTDHPHEEEEQEMVIDFEHHLQDHSTAFFSAAASELADGGHHDDPEDDLRDSSSPLEEPAPQSDSVNHVSSLSESPASDDHHHLTKKHVYNFVWEYTEALTLAAAYVSSSSSASHHRWKAFWDKYHTDDYQHVVPTKTNGSMETLDRTSVAEQMARYREYTLSPLAVESIQLMEDDSNDTRTNQKIPSSSPQEALCTFKTQQTYWDPNTEQEVDEFVTWNGTVVWQPDGGAGDLQWSRMERASGRSIHDATASTTA